MPEDPPRQPISAAAPFDRKDADVILSSSDNVHFRVHRAILMIASPFFDSMFRLPQPPDARDDIPVVHVTEDSYTLDVLLRMCYPVARPAMTLGLISSALEAANKYDMCIVKASLKEDLRHYISSYPLRVFVVACRLEDESIATAAAAELERVTGPNDLPPFADVFGELPAGCYHRLLQYLKKTGIPFLHHILRKPFVLKRADQPVERDESLPSQNKMSNTLSDQHGTGDLTIVTSDGIHLRTSKTIMTVASSIIEHALRDACSPQLNPDSESVKKQSQSIFRVPEDSKTMEGLIHICWPAGVPMSINVRWIPRISMVARKYKMERAMWILQQQWKTSATTEPLRAYLLAASSGWKEEACATARALLSQKFSHIRDTYVPELETTPTGPYYRLLLFHKACGDAAAKVNPQLLDTWTCNCDANWKALHVQRISRSLAIQPSASVFNNETMFGELLQDMGSCFNCQSKLTHVLSTHATYGRMVEEATAKVDINMLFSKST